jgi:hypothetical protein
VEGFSLCRTLAELLNESATSSFLNSRDSYEFIWEAVLDFNKRTHYQTNVQTIAISPGVAAYNLNPDYVDLALFDSYNQKFIKYTTGGNDSFLYAQLYATSVLQDTSTAVSPPTYFSINDAAVMPNWTGTASSAGASVNGECTLTDTTATFTNAFPGDFVHNTTDGSSGVVIAVTSATQVVCALFEGTSNDWSPADAYIIVPQARWQIVFTPAPASADTATISYIQRPTPVYSPYRSYRLPLDAKLPVVSFAAFLYKYKDREPNFGDAYLKTYDAFCRKVAAEMRAGTQERSGMRCNFSKQNARSNRMGQWR